MMLCSPTRLIFTLVIWRSPELSGQLTESYKNLTKGQSYDCALLTVPCESNITKALFKYDDDMVYWFDLIHKYIFNTLFVLVGIIGNVINIIIFSTTNIANGSTTILLLALSVSDLLCLLNNAVLLFGGFLCFIDASLAITFWNVTLAPILAYNRWFGLLGVDLVTVISIQRAVAVFLPFKIATIFSQRNTKIIVFCLYCVCLCTLLPANLGYIPQWVFHPYFRKYISLGFTYLFDYIYFSNYVLLYPTIRSCIDLLVLMVCVSSTVLKLKLQATSRLSMTFKAPPSQDAAPVMSSREMSAIKMSITICLVTFIIYSFSTGLSLFLQAHAEKLHDSLLPIFLSFSNFLLFSIMSSFNFFLYLVMSTKFKEKFRQLFSFLIIWH